MPTLQDQARERYARLLATRAPGITPGARMLIEYPAEQLPFAELVAEEARRAGARKVVLLPEDAWLERHRIATCSLDELGRIPPNYVAEFMWLFESPRGSYLYLYSGPDFHAYDGLDPAKVAAAKAARAKARAEFKQRCQFQMEAYRCTAAVPSEWWAKKLYPDYSPDRGTEATWTDVLRVARADREDCLQWWEAEDLLLRARAQRLNTLQIARLRVIGDGTDLVVGLSERAMWASGSKDYPSGDGYGERTSWTNFPSIECFTSPDWRQTSGTVRFTKPMTFLTEPGVVRDLVVTFSDGQVTEWSAGEGRENFERLMQDQTVGRLGEVSLVACSDALPAIMPRELAHNLLFDENGACHVAFGNCYDHRIRGFAQMSADERAGIGANRSPEHCDAMISDPSTRVIATTRDGREVVLMERGEWTPEWAQ